MLFFSGARLAPLIVILAHEAKHNARLVRLANIAKVLETMLQQDFAPKDIFVCLVQCLQFNTNVFPVSFVLLDQLLCCLVRQELSTTCFLKHFVSNAHLDIIAPSKI